MDIRLEQRQLAKVQRLGQPHHFIPEHPLVVSSDTKIAKKQLALERKRVKTAKEERWILAGEDLGKAVIRGAAYAGGQAIRGFFLLLKGIAENPDPVSQGISIASLWAGFEILIDTYPEVSKAVGLDRLSLMHRLRQGSLSSQSGSGKFCISFRGLGDFFSGGRSLVCYVSAEARDNAFNEEFSGPQFFGEAVKVDLA